jgi:hypothetical protein
MKKALLVVLALALVPTCGFAVDGVVLINQSTVVASGGFPYVITEPGSYRLSGNLVAPSNSGGIVISADHVTIDLNGFNVECSANLNSTGAILCIGEGSTAHHHVSVRNGTLTLTGSGAFLLGHSLGGVSLTGQSTVEDLQIDASSPQGFFVFSLSIGPGSIVRHNIVAATPSFSCPVFVEGNVNTSGALSAGGIGCVGVNNVGIIGLP